MAGIFFKVMRNSKLESIFAKIPITFQTNSKIVTRNLIFYYLEGMRLYF